MTVVRLLKRLAPESELRRGVAVLVGGTTMAQGIIVVTSPVLTRLYAPAEVGIYSVAISIVSILIVVSCLRYELAIPLPENDVAAANVLGLSLVTTLGTSLMAGVALWIAGPSLLALFGASVLSPYIPLFTLAQMGGGVVLALTMWAIRTKSFSAIAATRLTQSGALVVTQVGLGLLRFGAPALLLGTVMGSVTGSSRLARAAWRTDAAAFHQLSRTGIVAAARRYRRFPVLSAPSALLNTMGLQAPLLLIVALFGTSVGGQYALAERICGLPVALVATAVGQVFFGEAARLAREKPAGMLGLFWRTTRSLARLAIGPFVLMAVTAPFLAGFVFGENWRDAGLFVAILAPMYFLQFVMSPSGSVLDVLERQDLGLFREVLRLCLVGGAVIIAAAAGLPPVGAVCALSAAICSLYILYGLISWRAIVHRDRLRPPAPATEPGQSGHEEVAAVPVTVLPSLNGRGVLLIRTPQTRVVERRYVLDVVLGEWLGLDYRLEFGHEPGVSIRLSEDPQGRELTLPDLLFATSPADWLTQRSMPVPPLAQQVAPLAGPAAYRDPDGPGGTATLPVLFGDPAGDGRAWRSTATGVALDLDIFGSVFYLLTRYEEVARPVSDRYARFPAKASLAATAGFLDRPIVDEYVDLLWMAIHSLWPGLQRPRSDFRLRLTHDVDAAWATYGRRPGGITHALVGDLLNRRDPRLAVHRLRSVFDLHSGRVDRDPFNTFDFLMDTSERHGLRSTFYFMAGVGASEFDGEYRLSDPHIHGLLRRIHERGHGVGLHASYGSHGSPDRIRAEFEALRCACRLAGFDQATWGVRQHYLRFENPQTWRSQESAGFDYDSTLGFADRIGFRAGTCREFPIFDLLAGRTLQLRERPLLITDGTLFKYMGLGLEEAASQACAIVDACRLHGGDAVLLYHNHTVAGVHQAAHYRDLVERLSRSTVAVNPGVAGDPSD